MGERWSEKHAWEWYNSIPWLRGCNFLSSDCCNRIDQLQEEGFEKRLTTADRELELASSIGYNTIRMILQFEVWDEQHDGFMQRLDRYLHTADKHGISVMLCFGNDCCVPKDENYKPLRMGKQHYDWGYHGGRANSPHAHFKEVGYNILDDPDIAPRVYEMVGEVIARYKDDRRVVIWDLYNEAGNSNRDCITIPHVKKFFEIAREINPSQPLTSCLWKGLNGTNKLPEVEEYIAGNSDIISYHHYGNFDVNIQVIERLKDYGRPIVNTEWLNRMTHNNLDTLFPIFYLEHIGCYNWGFVAGLSQTYEPWEGLWTRYYERGQRDIDFTKWQHDLFRPSLRPYDPKEIEVIQKYSRLADERFAEIHDL
jgi:hypothetical protein